jgi:dienelactone hydrolase
LNNKNPKNRDELREMRVFVGAGLLIYSSITARQSLAFQCPFHPSLVVSRIRRRRRRPFTAARCGMELSHVSHDDDDDDDDGACADWQELSPDALVAAPCLIEQTLCQAHGSESCRTTVHQYALPQLAGTVDYARSILDAWRNEIESSSSTAQYWPDIEWKRVQYADCHGTPLYGHLVRRRRRRPVTHNDDTVTQPSTTDFPTVAAQAVLLFGTAAGPHDVFLLWKAAALVHSLSAARESSATTKAVTPNVVVLVADVISDETGWGWHTTEDRSRYLAARTKLLQCSPSSMDQDNDGNIPHVVRRLLQDRIWAAVHMVESYVATKTAATATIHWAALGWCLGGQAIAEMARLEPPRRHENDSDQNHDPLSSLLATTTTPVNGDHGNNDSGTSRVKCMVTFHGVFDGLLGDGGAVDAALSPDSDDHCQTTCSLMQGCEILICHGVQDPFVPPSAVEGAL